MNKIFYMMVFAVTFYSLRANALFTDCKIDYTVTTFNLLIGGGSGSGTARCRDITGNAFDIPIKIGLVGAGAKIGQCTAHGHIEAVGIGFALDELLGAQLKLEGGLMVPGGGSAGVGANANPLGTNLSITGSVSRYEGPCLGFADLEGMVLSRDFGSQVVHVARPVPYEPALTSPPLASGNIYSPGGAYYTNGRYYYPSGIYYENGVYYTADGVAYYGNGHYLTPSIGYPVTAPNGMNSSYQPVPVAR